MIYRFLILFITFSPLILKALPPLSEVRAQFYAGVEDEEKTKKLIKALFPEKDKLPPIYLGYLGASQALLAKHCFNPYNKLDFLNKSIITFQTAISREPENLEIRFLRFSVQHFLPSFLGMSKNLSEDRDVIIEQIKKKNYPAEDLQLVKNVTSFLLESKRCTNSQQIFLKSNLL